MRLADVRGSVREFFTLERALHTATVYTPTQAERVQRLHAAGVKLLDAANELTSHRSRSAAVVLVRAAGECFLRATRAASGDAEEVDPKAALDAIEGDAKPGDALAELAQALSSSDLTRFESMTDAELARTRDLLERAAGWLAARVEPRPVATLRTMRFTRKAALAVAGAYILYSAGHALFAPTNLAYGKPVHVSSRHPGTPEPSGLTDGKIRGGFGVHTNNQESPWVRVDLGDDYALTRVKVYNRGDGWFDDCLPLVAEVSDDGVSFTEIAQRREHFSQDSPWDIDAHQARARYLRIRSPRKTYIALSEVEVFGHR